MFLAYLYIYIIIKMQQHAEDFEKRVVAIALTDSTATDWPKGKLQQLMKEVKRHFVLELAKYTKVHCIFVVAYDL